MIRKCLFTLLACFFISFTYAQYVPDILGDDYLCRTIQMPDDYEARIDVVVNPEEKTLTFTDNGLGMTAEEVEEYIVKKVEALSK